MLELLEEVSSFLCVRLVRTENNFSSENIV